MESSKIFPPKKEFIPMAHRIETPDNIAFNIKDAATNVVSSSKKDLIQNLAPLNDAINDLILHFNISPATVKSVRDVKAVKNGRFVKRLYQKIPGFGWKLVRDKMPSDGFLQRTDNARYAKLLKKKLREETKELIEVDSLSNRVEEVADVYEVRDTLVEALGLSLGSLEQRVKPIRSRGRRKLG